MKKTNIFKIVMTLVLAFAFSGAFAQSTDVPGAQADYAATGAVTVMQGSTIPLWAEPDSYFHPGYDPDVAGSLTAGYTWDWSDDGATGDLSFSNDGVEDNYTAVSGMVTGNSPYTIRVQETAPAAQGGCSDAGTTISMTVVAQPSWGIDGGDATYDLCAGDAGLPADMNTTIAGGYEAYHLAWTLEIATLDNASAKEFYYDDETGAGQAGAQKYAVEYTQANGSFDGSQNAPGTYDIMTVGSFPVINNGTRDAVTVYTYTLASINDRASRFGDFITLDGDDTDASAYTDYAATAASDQVVVTVYPAPTTGPIYHISNTWAN